MNFYSHFLGTANSDCTGGSAGFFQSLGLATLSTEMHACLIAEVSIDEVQRTLKTMLRNKTPRPDGYTVEFFITAWEVIGPLFVEAVQEFFLSGYLLKQLNATALTLVPKIPQPTKDTDFRPIACCNVVYKCISKILANRLKILPPHLISGNQSAFIAGRHIMDNILLAQEIIRDYGRQGGRPRCAIKLDIKKAFDSVSWQFTLNILQHMQFPPIYIGWIKECITTPVFFSCLNGQLEGFIKGGKGIRQGDPLSPTSLYYAWRS